MQSNASELHSHWDVNDFNEIYIIKAESLKKQYDSIVKKLQKERIKFMQQGQQSEEEGAIQAKSENNNEQFTQVKQQFMKKYQTQRLVSRKQKNMKRRFEWAQDQLKQEQNEGRIIINETYKKIMIYLFTILQISSALDFIQYGTSESQRSTIMELTNSEYVVEQTVKNMTVMLSPYNADTNKFIVIQLQIDKPVDGTSKLLLTATKNNFTSVVNSNQVQADYTDFNGYFLQKSYHNIQILPNTFKLGDDFYITIIIDESSLKPFIYSYSLKIIKSYTQLCPNDCTSRNYGTCINQVGTCDCNLDRMDLDCSKKTTPLMMGSKVDNIQVNGNTYFYYEMLSQMDSIQVTVELQSESDSTVTCYLMFEDLKFGAPSPGYNDLNFVLTKQDNSKKFDVNMQNLMYNDDLFRYERLLFTIVSTRSETISLEISQASSDSGMNTNLLLIYFLIALAIILLLTWIIITIIKYKQSRARVHDESLVRAGRPRGPAAPIMTQQIIDKYMPKIAFGKIHQEKQLKKKNIVRQPNDACSVCLLEFEDADYCRYTPCLHIFHQDCLSQWLLKHENCPNCRTELAEKDLIKFEQVEGQTDFLLGNVPANNVNNNRSQRALNRPHNPAGQSNIEL